MSIYFQSLPKVKNRVTDLDSKHAAGLLGTTTLCHSGTMCSPNVAHESGTLRSSGVLRCPCAPSPVRLLVKAPVAIPAHPPTHRQRSGSKSICPSLCLSISELHLIRLIRRPLLNVSALHLTLLVSEII